MRHESVKKVVPGSMTPMHESYHVGTAAARCQSNIKITVTVEKTSWDLQQQLINFQPIMALRSHHFSNRLQTTVTIHLDDIYSPHTTILFPLNHT